MCVNIATIYMVIYLSSSNAVDDSKFSQFLLDLNIPSSHVPYNFFNSPESRITCVNDDLCEFKKYSINPPCWGFEINCTEQNMLPKPVCYHELSEGWAKNNNEHQDIFWKQADFGYLKERMSDIIELCTPNQLNDSLLICSDHMKWCYTKNLYIDLTLWDGRNKDRHAQNIFPHEGMIGGNCKLHKTKKIKLGDHKSSLQSWFAELENFSEIKIDIDSPTNQCQVVIDKPTIFMKLDVGVNMYHYFCNFINLYSSQLMNNSLSLDIYIVMWDTSLKSYADFFSVTWKAFSAFEIIPFKKYFGKKICFRDAMFTLLPRMSHGLYYNMPLIPGCRGSNLFWAFSQHILHRLNIIQDRLFYDKVRITFLERGTKYRNIINQNELYNALVRNKNYHVTLLKYDQNIPFQEQLRISHNSDVFIGIHGAGLTHLLFQPDWGSIVELYNCGDPRCYSDLASLKGVSYFTWTDMDKIIKHPTDEPQRGSIDKFRDYSFDVEEFLKLVEQAVTAVKNHPNYILSKQVLFKNISPKDEL